MTPHGIGAQAVAFAGLRDLPSELTGPRPAAVRNAEQTRQQAELRTARITKP
jgi:hypothetical protein